MNITIGSKCFKLCKGEYEPERRYWTLYDAYENPSITKCCVWEEWCEWFYSMILTVVTMTTFLYVQRIVRYLPSMGV